ncbi:anthocyanidin 3-O-glucosyltransferase 4-like [Elaeis guineensis]|uniref:Anthocyanidin 3-O-glucosyltransferase 4-like n=1 Tax=Elaeis guineensis var. tenera TaxID=51953 RepID=A0A6I9RCJ0_ELAGV|nr:anthocyanidin 3-O-glucosyltransferase 4-like [Elaeis guineensis]
METARWGDETSMDCNQCLKLVKYQEAGLGGPSWFRESAQTSHGSIQRVALGLEASDKPLIWVVRGVRGNDSRGCGGIFDALRLEFLLGGVSAGMPMITWPMYAEQFDNEMLMVEVSKVGVGVKEFVSVDKDSRVMAREEIGRAVGRMVDEGAKAEGVRMRAWDLAEMARIAVEEGGSSNFGMEELIQE